MGSVPLAQRDRPASVDLLECMCQRRDGTVMLGLPMDYPGYDQTATLEGVGITAKVFAEHFPQLTRVEIGKSWAGLLPSTPDSLPYIGPPDGVRGLSWRRDMSSEMPRDRLPANSSRRSTPTGICRPRSSAPFRADRHQQFDPGVTGASGEAQDSMSSR